MKHLLVSQIFPPHTGGSGRWFWEIYRRFPRDEVVIAAGEHSRQEDFDRAHDLRVERLPLAMRAWGLRSVDGLRGYLRSVRRLGRLARAEGVGLVHAGRCLPEGVMARALRAWCGLPYVCFVHGEDVTCATTSRELTWLARRALHGATFTIANSHNTARILREEWGLPDDRVRLLHPGVDTRWFVPASRNSAVRARFGWGNRPVILTVGRLQRRKGHDCLIRALPTIRRAFPNALYVIVGDGDERGRLRSLVHDLALGGHVQFLGEIDDAALRECYQQCDLFVLPNRQDGVDIEGFGMVLLEAQACGKPVVAGDSGGTAETMSVPETGRIVRCDEPAPLAELIVRLLSDADRLARMGGNARRWVVEHFDWDSLSRQARTVLRPETGVPVRKLRSGVVRA